MNVCACIHHAYINVCVCVCVRVHVFILHITYIIYIHHYIYMLLHTRTFCVHAQTLRYVYSNKLIYLRSCMHTITMHVRQGAA